jgi:RNA polymerase sigma-70 factor (ECF subfamily)
MTTNASERDDLLQRGDVQVLVAFFARYRDRLRRMVRLRLDQRLPWRIDHSDVLQKLIPEG